MTIKGKKAQPLPKRRQQSASVYHNFLIALAAMVGLSGLTITLDFSTHITNRFYSSQPNHKVATIQKERSDISFAAMLWKAAAAQEKYIAALSKASPEELEALRRQAELLYLTVKGHHLESLSDEGTSGD